MTAQKCLEMLRKIKDWRLPQWTKQVRRKSVLLT